MGKEKTNYWTTKSGEDLLIKDLTDSHIVNILSYFNNQEVDEYRAEMIDAVIDEANKRGIKKRCNYELVDDEVFVGGMFDTF